MADVAFGVVGVVGVALQGATAVCDFLSSIRGAPHALKSLASHIFILRSILEHLDQRISKSSRQVLNVQHDLDSLKIIEDAVRNCDRVLVDLDREIRKYVRSQPNTQTPQWGSRGIRRRISYAFRKSKVLDLQRDLFAGLQILDLSLNAVKWPDRIQDRVSSEPPCETFTSAVRHLHIISSGPQSDQQSNETDIDHGYWTRQQRLLSEEGEASDADAATDPDPFSTTFSFEGRNHSVQAVVDSGFERNYVSASYLRDLGFDLAPSSTLLLENSPDDSRPRSGSMTLSFRVPEMSSRQFSSDFTILENTETPATIPNQVILGRSWIRQSLSQLPHATHVLQRCRASALAIYHIAEEWLSSNDSLTIWGYFGLLLTLVFMKPLLRFLGFSPEPTASPILSPDESTSQMLIALVIFETAIATSFGLALGYILFYSRHLPERRLQEAQALTTVGIACLCYRPSSDIAEMSVPAQIAILECIAFLCGFVWIESRAVGRSLYRVRELARIHLGLFGVLAFYIAVYEFREYTNPIFDPIEREWDRYTGFLLDGLQAQVSRFTAPIIDVFRHAGQVVLKHVPQTILQPLWSVRRGINEFDQAALGVLKVYGLLALAVVIMSKFRSRRDRAQD